MWRQRRVTDDSFRFAVSPSFTIYTPAGDIIWSGTTDYRGKRSTPNAPNEWGEVSYDVPVDVILTSPTGEILNGELLTFHTIDVIPPNVGASYGGVETIALIP